MTNFRIKSSFFTNILSVGVKDITNCQCTVHINNEYEMEMPLLVALSSFESVSRDLMSDITLRDFNIVVDFTTKVSDTFYAKLAKILHGYDVTLNEDEIINLAQFGISTNNHYFIEPYETQIKSIENALTLDNVFTLLSQKHKFSFSPENCTTEISLIAKNFETVKGKIKKLAEDATFIDIIGNIVSSESLRLKNEDSLLRFVIELCSINTTYETLFRYVWLEYCSIDTIHEFTSYVDSNIDTTQNNRSIFECMKRRLLEPKLPKSPNFSKGRHERPINEVTDEDPLRGILYKENQKGNVNLDASSTYNGNVFDLLKADQNVDFCTNNTQNSYIEASLKGNKSFIINKYMIRGNKCPSADPLQSWKLEGKKKSDNEYVILSEHNNEPFDQLETRVFDVSCNEPLTSVRLTQTSENDCGDHYFRINAFDIFGEYEQ